MPKPILLLLASVALFGETAQALFNRAVADFKAGRIAEAAAGFDQLSRIAPDSAPQLWQRGIALYYAGRYADCRKQFELHRTVNPNDVENAAWHFLCAAREDSPAKARQLLLPVGGDARVPMPQVLQMFRGELTPQFVMQAAGRDPEGVFYAHLYIGLYYEALGKKELAREHIRNAAEPKYSVGGYMHDVARLHLKQMQAR